VHIIDGKIVVDDDATLTVTATRESETGSFRRIVESGTILNSSTYSNRIKPERWSAEDTDKFFRYLTVYGSNFTLIANLFPSRNRRQIKNKFTAEDKRDPARITKCLEAKKIPLGALEGVVPGAPGARPRDGLPGTAKDLRGFMAQLKAGGLSGSDFADRDGARSAPHRSGSPETVALGERGEEGELLPSDDEAGPDPSVGIFGTQRGPQGAAPAAEDGALKPVDASEEEGDGPEAPPSPGGAADSRGPQAAPAVVAKKSPPRRRGPRVRSRVPESTPAVVDQVMLPGARGARPSRSSAKAEPSRSTTRPRR